MVGKCHRRWPRCISMSMESPDPVFLPAVTPIWNGAPEVQETRNLHEPRFVALICLHVKQVDVIKEPRVPCTKVPTRLWYLEEDAKSLQFAGWCVAKRSTVSVSLLPRKQFAAS